MRMGGWRREVVFVLLSLSAVFCWGFFSPLLLDRIYFVFSVMDREKGRRGEDGGGGDGREGGGRDDEGGEKRERKWLTGDEG